MVLALVRPASLGYDLCTFDCIKCERTERITLQTEQRRYRPLHAPD